MFVLGLNIPVLMFSLRKSIILLWPLSNKFEIDAQTSAEEHTKWLSERNKI